MSGTAHSVQDIPLWESVSIKRCLDARNTIQDSLSANRMRLNCKPLEALAHIAWDMFPSGKKREFWNALTTWYEGFPDWARSERYMIEAKAEGNPGQFMMAGPMLQALLEDHFQLKVHKEAREGKMYILS